MSKKVKGISINRTGDIIEVKLRDSNFDVFFKGTARAGHRKDMDRLLTDLKEKGFSFF